MSFHIKYRELFRMKVLHQFFLDKGSEEFFDMDETDQKKQLSQYDFRSMMNIVPTSDTEKKIKGHNLVFRPTNTGFMVLTKLEGENDQEPFIELADTLSLTFLMQLEDPLFYNYTDLKFENVNRLYYFSNKKPSTETPLFPLITQEGDHLMINEDFILSEEQKNTELELLEERKRAIPFGIIKIFMKGDDSALNITDATGKIPANTQTFELNLGNRSTVWRYFFDSEQLVDLSDSVVVENGDSKVLITKNEHPLAQTGYTPIKLGDGFLPNPGVFFIKSDSSINEIFSEIYM